MSGYRIQSLWRYPVKSMGGEELEAVEVSEAGLRGDRAYAFVDTLTGKVGSAKSVKRFGDLLRGEARFVAEVETGRAAPAVRIRLGSGREFRSDEAGAREAIAAEFGPHVALLSAAPVGLRLEFAAGTLGGEHAETTEVPLAEAAPAGRLFDYACVHLVTTSTLRRLQEAYPEGQFAIERFRPNVVVDSGDEDEFVENGWVGRRVAVGEMVVRVSIACPRCVMTTLPRASLPLDAGILRTIARMNRRDLGDFGELPCVGVYADVVTPARIRRHDAVRVLE